MSKLYKRIKVNCEVETATNLIRQTLDYLSKNGILLVPDGEDSLFHTADFRIMLPEPKDVGAVSVRKPKSWEPCVVDFYQFFDDAENTICAVYTVLRNVLDYYVLDTQDTSAVPDVPTTYAERSEKVPMKKTLTVAQPSRLAFLGEIIGWSFPFNMVDSSLVGTPEENSRTSPHHVQVSATLELVARWGFSLATFDGADEQSINDLMKVLFEHGKRYVIKKLRDTGELARIEKLDLNTSTPEARDRFDPSRIQDPVGATLEVDVDTQGNHTFDSITPILIKREQVQLSADTTQPKAVLGDGLSAKGEPTSYDLAKLRQNLAKHFNKDELRTLCFDMGIKHENLPADTLDGITRELVSYCDRAGKIHELVAKCGKMRPNVPWEGKSE